MGIKYNDIKLLGVDMNERYSNGQDVRLQFQQGTSMDSLN